MASNNDLILWHNAYLGLGSNLSNPKNQLAKAVTLLSQFDDIQIVTQAPLYQTPAWGVTDQPDFINSALHIKTTLNPQQLLTRIKDIEYKHMGRIKNDRWHERLIDIDILLFADIEINTALLTVPHPLITERWFVILPLLALNPPLPIELKASIQAKLDTENPPDTLIQLN